ncbi:hypothetical protein K502DRAFT_351273 [Neoconidiobolus thromboides FSU 785]|nr:hypothetical protein K502DRAFT_351273 [Neoconidiobolus thromboides FSU 785]
MQVKVCKQMEDEINKQKEKKTLFFNNFWKVTVVNNGNTDGLIKLTIQKKMNINEAVKELSINCYCAEYLTCQERQRLEKVLRKANMEAHEKIILESLIKLVAEGKTNIREAVEHLSIKYSSTEGIIQKQRNEFEKIVNAKKQKFDIINPSIISNEGEKALFMLVNKKGKSIKKAVGPAGAENKDNESSVQGLNKTVM